MGNQITSKAPAQILPLESYFAELTEYSKPTSLGSTRFLKVARATHSAGTEVVVKVFVKHDPMLQLETYRNALMEFHQKLYTTANALPFQHFWETDKAAFLVRQHIHYSLYDRISTRPFLSVMEKRWIIFQLLKVLEECDKRKINHGDIKSENVLLTGWSWVMLTDFASFKPTLLPDDNPADFSFFFDTSRRRTCYLAPERFCPPDYFQEVGHSMLGIQRSRVLTHQMDIFSLGCVIAELFLDGRPLFNLSQLLEYCSDDRDHFESTLKLINNKVIRRLVRHMTWPDPRKRYTAREYLERYKDDIFPEYFYSFLHDYFKEFCITAQLTPDQCIQKLYGDIEKILANIVVNHKQDREKGYGDALVIVLSAITSHLRVAQFAASKLQALQMMRQISHHVTDEFILERVIPYVVLLLKDTWPSVKAEAITTVTKCLSLVKHLPSSDYNLFLEYILPAMITIPSDKDVIVRLSFAECVAELAETAHRFLELAQLHANQEDDSVFIHYQVQGSYDSELMQLQESFQDKIVHLLSDTESSVKKAFLKHSAGKLCVFFGPQRAKEVILSHMITFLNDKSDWELHKAFFECIVSVATLLRHHSLPILEPLLQQGLSDSEESVICKTIEAITILCGEKLFDKETLFANITALAPFLVHSNMWVRYGAVGFLISASKQLDVVDNECFLLPQVRPFLQYPIIQIQDCCVFLSALREPIPRGVLDYILKQQGIHDIFECLKHRAVTRSMTPPGKIPNYPNIDGHLIPVFKKLQSLGLNEEHENSLMALRDHILKQHISKQQYSEVESHYSSARGVINIKSLPGIVVPRSRDLHYKPNTFLPSTNTTIPSGKKKKTGSTGSDKSQVNEDWDRLFGEPVKTPPAAVNSGSSSNRDTISSITSTMSSSTTSSSTISRSRKPTGSPETRRRAVEAASMIDSPPSSLPKSPSKLQQEGELASGGGSGGKRHMLSINRKSQVKTDKNSPSSDVSRSSENLGMISTGNTENSSPRGSSGKSSSEAASSGHYLGDKLKTHHQRSHSEGAISRLNQTANDKEGISDGGSIDGMSPGFIEQSMVKVEYASCKENLKGLLDFKQKEYEEDMQFMDIDLTRNAAFQTSPGWIPKGQPVAHIHEHKDAINRLRVLPDTSMFASFSNDGCTKLWDVTRLEAKAVVNRPKVTYSHQGGQIKAGSFCQVNRSIAAASTNGSIQIFNIETKRVGGGASRRQLTLDVLVNPTEKGTIVDMNTFSMGGEEVLCYVTSMGKLCGLDIRAGKTVWELTNNAKFGLTLSMAVDPFENWVALGTSLGYHVIWDMRFQLPIRHWQHTGHGKFNVHHVYQLSSHPTQPSSLISAVSYNNEISIWDMETASRRQMLWASSAPAFGEMTSNPRQQDSVRALSTCIVDNCPVVLSGGTDRTIRLWNLVDPSQCCCIVRPKHHSKRISYDYVSKITEGVDVFMEVFSVGTVASSASFSGQPSSGSNSSMTTDTGNSESAHSNLHVDFITDLVVLPYKQQQFIVSGSQDGVIKYWK